MIHIAWRAALSALAIFATAAPAYADAIEQTKGNFQDKFRQLEVDLPSPNVYRTASGEPGAQYWQQRADYTIKVRLDEAQKRIIGEEVMTYTNNSPDTLRYIWVQLDQNIFDNRSIARRTELAANQPPGRAADRLTFGGLAREYALRDVDYGFDITKVTDARGKALAHIVVDTMMRIDLPALLAPKAKTAITIGWGSNIIEEDRIGGRSGYERFRDSDTYLYFLAQWHPRVAAYTDYTGWQHKAFLGRGEFTLEFGDYDVAITVPADHIVSSTGELQNPQDVLSAEQRTRLAQARDAKTPMFIVTPEEALANEKDKSTDEKTWRFVAKNVRDFAWASSNKFIWDAMGYRQDDPQTPFVMAMSFYPHEAEPLWSKYSTHAVVHTMEVYSKYSFAYPYPTAQSVNTWDGGGMEYPMITFNGSRPVIDKKTGERTYTQNAKYGLIGVVIHEIGHIYFPMTVNSDERQWTWMDEGLNTFLEYVAEQEWEEGFPAFGNRPNIMDAIGEYMRGEDQTPIMTQSDSIIGFGPNGYTKPAAGLTVLRETIMGRELFDFAFREYSRRWKFKRPTPADFFRTMEDASGIDLDWFWRGWFYTTDHVDLAISDVREYKIATKDPDQDKPAERTLDAAKFPPQVAEARNRAEGIQTRVERFPELKDFYNENDRFTVTNKDRNSYQSTLEGLDEWEKETLERAIKEGQFVYFVEFENKGGLVMPLPLTVTYADGAQAKETIPAEIWRIASDRVTKMMFSDKPIASIALDADHEMPDINRADNHFPRRIDSARIDLFRQRPEIRNLMADAMTKLRSEEKKEEGKDVPLAPAPPTATPQQ